MQCSWASSKSSSWLEKYIFLNHTLWLTWASYRSFHKLIKRGNSVSVGSSTVLKDFSIELTCFLIHIFDWHELLVEKECSCDVGSLESAKFSNIFQNAKTIRDVFPEKSCIKIQLNHLFSSWNTLKILSRNWKHWERNVFVTLVGLEHCVESWFVTYLSFIHGANSFSHWHHLR